MPFDVEVTWGGVVELQEGFDGAMVEAIAFFDSFGHEPRTFRVDLWRWTKLSFVEQLQAGQRLHEATARVLLDGVEVLAGRLRDIQSTDDPEAVAFTIEGRSLGRRMWPTTAPPVPDIVLPSSPFRPDRPPVVVQVGDELRRYPVVFGAPGKGISPFSGAPTTVPGSPAVLRLAGDGSTNFWAFAGHPLQDSVVGLQANPEASSGTSYTVVGITDASGSIVPGVTEATVTAGPSPLYATANDRPDVLGVRWAGDGGLPGELGEVVDYLLRQVPRRTDERRIAASKHQLNRYRVDTYFLEPEDIEDVLADVLEEFPVALVDGPAGLWVWVWDPDEDPVGTLRVAEAPTVEATGVRFVGWRMGDDDPVKSVRLRYMHHELQREFQLITSTSGAAFRVTDLQIDGAEEVRDAIHIYDTATAQRCADLRMRARGRPPTIVELEIDRDVWQRFGVGDCVTLDHPRGGLAGRKGWITRCSDAGTDVLDIEVTITEPLPGET
jgi:hypothetical protein